MIHGDTQCRYLSTMGDTDQKEFQVDGADMIVTFSTDCELDQFVCDSTEEDYGQSVKNLTDVSEFFNRRDFTINRDQRSIQYRMKYYKRMLYD